MDELLFRFSGERFAVKEVRITELDPANLALEGASSGTRRSTSTAKPSPSASCTSFPPGEEDEFEDDTITAAPLDSWRAYV
ncbi:hypothetical protein DIPPA_03263 [Diplonema papillatum]|nr:hypothetical protein DIPPA_03263 [Diplonema papillatum]